MTKARKKFHVAWLLLILIITLGIWLALDIREGVKLSNEIEKYIDKHCPAYEQEGEFLDRSKFIDCRNNVVIQMFLRDGQMYIDNLINDNEVKVDGYVLSDDFVYFVEEFSLNPVGTSFSAEGEKSHLLSFQVNGIDQVFEFSTVDDIPLYRKINTKTGDFTLYKTLNEIPEEERRIFINLENTQN